MSSLCRFRLVVCLLFTLFCGAALGQSGLQKASPWPKFQANLSNSGLGAGKSVTGGLKWSLSQQGFSSAPVISADGTIYLTGSWGSTYYAVDSSNGAIKWSDPISVGGSAAIGVDGTLFVPSRDGNLYAIDGASGSQKWQSSLGGPSSCSPAIGADGTIYVSSETSFFAIDSVTGVVRWSSLTFASTAPAIGLDGTLYLGGTSLYAVDPAEGTVEWSFDYVGPCSPPTVGNNGLVYVAADRLYALNAKNGNQVWADNLGSPSDSEALSRPLIALGPDGTIYYPGYEIYALNPNTGAQKWGCPPEPDGGTTGELAVSADGTVYAGIARNLCSIDPSTGQREWALATGSRLLPVAIGSDGTIYGNNDDGDLLAIGNSNVARFYCAPAQIAGGNPGHGVIQLTSPAPAGGLTLSVGTYTSEQNVPVTLPAQVTVPAGQTGVSFSFSTRAVPQPDTVTIGAQNGLTTTYCPLVVNPNSLANFYVTPSSAQYGVSLEGVVQLAAPAPAGGSVVSIQTGSAVAIVPASVTVPAGATGASFKIVYNFSSAGTDQAYIRASFAGSSLSALAEWVSWAPFSNIYVSPNVIQGGQKATGVVQLAGQAGTSDQIVLKSGSPSVIVPASVVIPPGASGVSFPIASTLVNAPETVFISAYAGSLGTVQTQIVVYPTPPISKLYLSASSVVSGSGLLAVVQLGSPAGSGGCVISLASDSAEVTVPKMVTVPSGSTGISFPISTAISRAFTSASITAVSGASAKTATLAVQPDPYPLSSFSTSASNINGGGTLLGIVRLTGPSVVGGETVSLRSNNSAASVPSTINIPVGVSGKSFSISTGLVSTSTPVTLTSWIGSSEMTAGFTLTPGFPVSSLTITPSSITGVVAVSGVVRIAGPTTGGETVSLQSSSPDAKAPATVAIQPGLTANSFSVTASLVWATENVTITASLGSSSKQATLTLNPVQLSFYFSPASVKGGSTTVGVLQFIGLPINQVATANLTSSDTHVQVPSSVTTQTGSYGASFEVTTHDVTSTTTVTITATYATLPPVQATVTLTP